MKMIEFCFFSQKKMADFSTFKEICNIYISTSVSLGISIRPINKEIWKNMNKL